MSLWSSISSVARQFDPTSSTAKYGGYVRNAVVGATGQAGATALDAAAQAGSVLRSGTPAPVAAIATPAAGAPLPASEGSPLQLRSGSLASWLLPVVGIVLVLVYVLPALARRR